MENNDGPNAAVEYRECPGYPDYRVGNDGSVWSGKRHGRAAKHGGRWFRLKLSRVKPKASLTEYVVVGLYLSGKGQIMRLVHHLVLEAFVGPRPVGMECCHKDGHGFNNSLENLRWDTSAANKADFFANENHSRRGARVGTARLTEESILAILAARSQGADVPTLAKLHAVSASQIYRIINRENWGHVK